MNKVIIAEDIKSIHQGLASVLKKFEVEHIDFVQYCDDAYLQIKKAYIEENPYDLLITDLSFVKDHRDITIPDGESLIKKLKKENLNLKVLVFSVEDRLERIKKFFNYLNIDAYVCKGRNDQKDLNNAIEALQQNKKYFLESSVEIFEDSFQQEITNYDIKLLEMLEQGHHQSEISKIFKKEAISPSSVSALEKRINNLKIFFKAKNTINLVAKAKDLGII